MRSPANPRLTTCKHDFYGRLAAAANACLERGPGATDTALCAAVLSEARAMLGEMERGEF